MRHPVYSRVLRRETHSPRSVAAIAVAVVLIVACAYVIVELVLALIGADALLVSPADALPATAAVTSVLPAVLVASGAAAIVVGLVLLVIALAPGRRARHLLPSDRAAVVVDNEVIASSLARTASTAGRVDPDNAVVSVSHRRATVRLQPASGHPLDRDVIAEAVTRHLDTINARPRIAARLDVSETGKVGA